MLGGGAIQFSGAAERAKKRGKEAQAEAAQLRAATRAGEKCLPLIMDPKGF